MSDARKDRPRLPPRWFIRLFWRAHRGVYRVTGGRVGLWSPRTKRWGTLRLITIGRRTGKERSVILGYFKDGPNLVTLAMNGWADGEPTWWLNLQAHPAASIDLPDGPCMVTARAEEGDERARLWARWQEIDKNLDAYAALRSSETAVVVLEPQATPVAGRPPHMREHKAAATTAGVLYITGTVAGVLSKVASAPVRDAGDPLAAATQQSGAT